MVSLPQQRLWHQQGARTLATYPIAYSTREPSCVENSLGTPWGLHTVAEKYGDGAPAGQVFEARVDTGLHYAKRPDAGPEQKALVTTRILRLRGLEPGLNAGPGVDSFARYIYLHGTNHPERFPERLTAGCLHLRDSELIELYAAVPSGTLVYISRDL